MRSTFEAVIFLTPILPAFVVGAGGLALLGRTRAPWLKFSVALGLWLALSLCMSVLTLNYLLGPGCAFCYDPPRFRIAAEYLGVVAVYGLLGWGLAWWAGGERKEESVEAD